MEDEKKLWNKISIPMPKYIVEEKRREEGNGQDILGAK